jgi:hypothetical protein
MRENTPNYRGKERHNLPVAGRGLPCLPREARRNLPVVSSLNLARGRARARNRARARTS